jgi:pyroglutamyl-peptidase
LFVTGFGSFGAFTDNPSANLAESCGHPHQVLEVSFAAVEEALANLPDFDALLMIGVAGNTEVMRLETVAHNRIGKLADVQGVVAGPGPIDPAAPFQLHAPLWTQPDLMDAVTVDAGDYLCNYSLFRAIQLFPTKLVGFLHVPPVDKMPLERQRTELAQIIEQLQSAS